jgi:hypothetical protein
LNTISIAARTRSSGSFSILGLQGIEWVIWGIIGAEKPVDRGFLKL